MKKLKLDYSWVIIAICFLMVSVVLGFCSSSKGIFIAPITDALNISRSSFAVNDSLRFITTAVISLFFGALVDRFGAKKLICAGFVCLILSSLLYTVADRIYLFYPGGILLGAGLSWTTTTMVGYVVHKWCKRNTGTITGAVLASNGVGAALAMQVLSPVIYREGDPFAYRDAYRLVVLILLATAVLVLLFFKNEPSEEQESVRPEVKKRRDRAWRGLDWTDVVKKPYFYGAMVCIFLTGCVLQGMTGIAAPLMNDVGLTPAFVATALSVHAIALTCFKLLTGVLYDRFGLRITISTCMITSAVVMFLLSLVTASKTGMVLAVLYCIFSGLGLPLETVMLPIYTSDMFGEKSYNKILGIVVSVNTAGYAVGAPLANLCYDLTGTYHIALYASCGLLLCLFAVMQFVISAAQREQKKAGLGEI